MFVNSVENSLSITKWDGSMMYACTSLNDTFIEKFKNMHKNKATGICIVMYYTFQ